MKRWCFDNKNKKNNFYTQRIQSFFYFFKSFFSFSFFLILFFKHRNSFFVTRISVGKFLRAFLIFFTRTHTRIPPRFLPRTLKHALYLLLALFELSDNSDDSEFSDNSHFSRTILNFQNIPKCIFIHFQILPPANYQNIHNILKLNFCRGGVASWKFQYFPKVFTFINPIIYKWRVI